MIVRWSRGAARQLFRAGDALADRRPGADERLYAEVRQLTEILRTQPRAFARVDRVRDGEVCKLLVDAYDHWVIYEVFEARDEVVVLAFWPTRRHPDGWRCSR